MALAATPACVEAVTMVSGPRSKRCRPDSQDHDLRASAQAIDCPVAIYNNGGGPGRCGSKARMTFEG